MISINTFLYVFLGGGIGSVLRYTLSVIAHISNIKMWAATLLANAIGAIIIAFTTYKLQLDGDLSAFVRIGLLGGLTTFSTFSLEVLESLKSGNYVEAGLILFLNIFFGVVVSILVFR